MVQNKKLLKLDTNQLMKKFIIVSVLLFFPVWLSAQNSNFPAWMDEVEFKKPSAQSESSFKQFKSPIDPETGAPADITTKNSISDKFKKPRLPDFEKLRQKAVKVDSASTKKSKENSYNAQAQLKSEKNSNQISDLLQAMVKTLPADSNDEKQKNLKEKVTAFADLISLIQNEKQSLTDTLGKFSFSKPAQALQLQQLLNPNSPQSPQSSVKESKTQQRFYKPAKFKSFFLESKKKNRR